MNQHECLDAIRKLQFFAIDLNLYFMIVKQFNLFELRVSMVLFKKV